MRTRATCAQTSAALLGSIRVLWSEQMQIVATMVFLFTILFPAIELASLLYVALGLRGGVKVDAADGAAARAGLREGDVILALDNTEINDLKQFMAVASKVEKARAVSVMVRRGEWVNYLVIRPGR